MEKIFKEKIEKLKFGFYSKNFNKNFFLQSLFTHYGLFKNIDKIEKKIKKINFMIKNFEKKNKNIFLKKNFGKYIELLNEIKIKKIGENENLGKKKILKKSKSKKNVFFKNFESLENNLKISEKKFLKKKKTKKNLFLKKK